MILDEIVEDKKKRLPGHMARIPETEMRRMAEETKTREADCFYNHLKKNYSCSMQSGHLQYRLCIL